MSATVSFGKFATMMRVSRPAVSKAYKSKRLNKSVAKDAKGQPVIVDVELAKSEWVENSSRPVTKGGAAVTTPPTPPPGSADDDDHDDWVPERIALPRITVWPWGDNLMGLAVTRDEDTDPVPGDVVIAMSPEDAALVGEWLHKAALKSLNGIDE